ncbi:MAG: lysophospholipid acyltransferase family protein [Pseudomonadota bacterium]
MLTDLRSAAYAGFMVVATILMAIICLPTLLAPRRVAERATRVWARLMLWGLKSFCGLSHRAIGAENRPEGAAIVAAKHQSAWETIAFIVELPRPVVILKKELLNIPIYGWWARKCGHIAIDRSAGAKALRQMTAAVQAALDDGRQVVIFPEGTRVAPGEEKPLQPGISGLYQRTGAPVIPVAHDSGVFWRHPGLRRASGVITLSYLQPLPGGLDRRSFQSQLKHAIDAETARLLAAPANRP